MQLCSRYSFLSVVLLLSTFFNCTSTSTPEKKIPPAGLAGTATTKEQIGNKKERNIIEGIILEIIQKKGFSYLQIQTPKKNKEWIAILESKVKVGEQVFIEEQVVLTDFHSKSIDRTFPKIIFGILLKDKP